MLSKWVKILSTILIIMIVSYFIILFLIVALLVKELNEFINYMENAFIYLYNTIILGVINFFDVLYSDFVDLIDDIF